MPSDSFERFVGLGPARSYAKLAAALGCSKRSVTARASREGWQAKLARVEAEAQRRTEERAVDDLAAVDERHLKTARAVLARGLEALRTSPLPSAAAAVRAIEAAVRMERLVLGTDRPAAQGQSGVVWREILDDVRRRAEARREEIAAAGTAAPPRPAPVVLPPLLPRIAGEN